MSLSCYRIKGFLLSVFGNPVVEISAIVGILPIPQRVITAQSCLWPSDTVPQCAHQRRHSPHLAIHAMRGGLNKLSPYSIQCLVPAGGCMAFKKKRY